jgi:hypothetical protein
MPRRIFVQGLVEDDSAPSCTMDPSMCRGRPSPGEVLLESTPTVRFDSAMPLGCGSATEGSWNRS